MPIDFYFGVNKGRLHNGVLHWMATGINSNVIVCFDISDETFREVPLPKKISNEDEDPYDSDLGIWEGKLCILHRNHKHIDVWTMMDDKWSKPLKITAQITDLYYGRPIQTLQNGEILLFGVPLVEEGLRLMSYDPKLERARVTEIYGFPEEFEVEAYIETLVALNSGTYVGQ
ncbi:hypothetical protein MKW92_018512 [Papaver armeniacum]|nr:hypothetical protein MKW92_018512 [Papaver armeniacum]